MNVRKLTQTCFVLGAVLIAGACSKPKLYGTIQEAEPVTKYLQVPPEEAFKASKEALAAQGYSLVGGRVAYVDHQRAAVVVYRHGAHIINVFTWASAGKALPRTLTRDGYHLSFWTSGDLQYCAVSDTGWDELRSLVTLLQNLDARSHDAGAL